MDVCQQFYQIHVPKTGGNSLGKYAEKHGLNWDRKSGGHDSFSTRTIPPKAVVITTLRCPIKQTISLYTWRISIGNDLKPFSKWLREPILWTKVKWKWFPDLYLSFFGDGDFHRAVCNLKRVDHIIDTNRLTEQFNFAVADRYNLPRLQERENPSAISIKPSLKDITYIAKMRAQDIKLCKMFGIETWKL